MPWKWQGVQRVRVELALCCVGVRVIGASPPSLLQDSPFLRLSPSCALQEHLCAGVLRGSAGPQRIQGACEGVCPQQEHPLLLHGPKKRRGERSTHQNSARCEHSVCAEQCSEPAVGVFLGEGHLGCLTARFLIPAWFKRGFVAWLYSRVLKIGEWKRRNCPCGSGKGWGYGPTPST